MRRQVPHRFHTDEQVERARDLAAYGPLSRADIDAQLDALGWTQRYDGDPLSSDLTPTARRALYDDRGRLHDCWRPR